MTARAAAAALAALAIAGCGGSSTGGVGKGSGALAVYMSVPLTGERGAEGRMIAAAAKGELARAGGRAGSREVKLIVLDDTGGGRRWSPVATGANARTATESADTIAYLGDLDQGASATSLPITDRAEVPQIVLGPVPRGVDVGNLVELPPSDPAADPGGDAIGLVLAGIKAAGGDAGDREAVLDAIRDAAAAGA